MLKIREATAGDAEALQELYLKHLTQYPPKEPQSLEKWREMLNSIALDSNYHILIGEVNGQAVSSVTLVVIKNLTHNLSPYAVIENVVTHGDFRCRGCGKALMNRACELAKLAGCYKIMLMTGSKRESTLRFYEDCGFNRQDKTAFVRREN